MHAGHQHAQTEIMYHPVAEGVKHRTSPASLVSAPRVPAPPVLYDPARYNASGGPTWRKDAAGAGWQYG